MSIPLPRAILLTLVFLIGNFLMQALIAALPPADPGRAHPSSKLLLSLAFVIPLIPVFLIQKQWPSKFFRREGGDSEGMPAKFMTLVLLAAPLIAFCMLVLGTELLNYTRLWAADEKQYLRMMKFIGPDGTSLDMGGAFLTIGLVGPLCEELLFRGLLLRGIEVRYREKGGVALAVFFQAMVFALVHLNQFQFPYALGAGLLLGYLAWWTGGIIVPLAIHILINTTQITILYFFPTTPWFAYKGPGIIEHIPWYLVFAAAIVLTITMMLIRRAASPLTRSPVHPF